MKTISLIDLQVARQFLSDPKVVVLREATEITDDAATELAGYEELLWLDGIEQLSETAAIALGQESTEKSRLSLNGVAELTDEAALGLSAHKGTLFLDGLGKLSVTAALALERHLGEDLLKSIFPQKIDAYVAKQFIKDQQSVSLERADSITEEAAKEFAEFDGEIRLNNFWYLDTEEAAWLAKHKGKLVLNSLEWISGEMAEALAKHAGDLSLDGLSSLTTTAAEYLATCEGDLSLGGLQEITAKGARALLSKGGIHTAFDLKSLIPDLIDCDAVGRLIEDPDSVDITSASTITKDALDALEDYSGNLALNGLEEISIEQAKALVKVRGILALDGLASIDDETAAILATHQGGYLSLNCLSDLTDQAKNALTSYNGLILINGEYWRDSSSLIQPDEYECQQTRIVDALNHGDHTTIHEALISANAGDRILIRPGLYREGITIDKPVQVIGDGPLEKILIEATGMAAVLFIADKGSIENLTIRQIGGGEWHGINITEGSLNVENCDITSLSYCCIAIHNYANPTLRGNRIHDGKQAGVFVYTNGLGTLEDNDIFGNTLSGVEIKEGGNPTLRGNRIHDSRESGVYVHKNGLGTLEDNDIFGNAFSGVAIKESGNPTLRGNRIHDGKGGGVYVYENGLGTLEDNDIFGNELSGVEIERGGNPTLRGNRIHDGKADGVYVHDNGLGTLQDNDISGNVSSGVEIREGGNPTLRGNRIFNNTQFGTLFKSNGLGVLEDNEIYNNVFSGILIREGANPSLFGNRIYEGKQCGVFVCMNGLGSIEDNEIFRNAFAGVEISESGNPKLRRNRIHDNKSNGVYIHNNGLGTLEQNVIFANSKENISVTNGSNPTILENFTINGKLTSIDSLSSVIAHTIIKQPDPEFVFNNLKSLSSKVAAVLARTPATLEFSSLDTITVEAAEALIPHVGNLNLPSITELPPRVSAVLAQHTGALNLNNLRKLSVEDAEAFSEHNGRLGFPKVSTLDLDAVRNLVSHRGGLDLSGLTSVSVDVAEALSEYDGDLNLSGLTEISDHAARHLARHEGTLRLNGLTSLSDAAAEFLFQHSGSLFLDGIQTLTAAARESLDDRQGYVSLASLPDIRSEEELAFEEGIESLDHAGQFLSEGEEFFIHGIEAEDDFSARDNPNGSHYETRVAGVTFENRIVVVRTMSIDDTVKLRREPENEYDPNAIQVLTTDSRELGYVPRDLAQLVAGSIDTAGGEISGRVVSVQKGDLPSNHLSLSVSFQIDQDPGNGVKQIAQPVVSSDPSQIVSGQLFADGGGRFFVMELKNSYATVYYENGMEKQIHEIHLRNLAATWPQITLRTIPEIKIGLFTYGLKASDDPFHDHDRLTVLNKKSNAVWQKFAIKNSRAMRKELLELKRLIPKVRDITDFDFRVPPEPVSFRKDQIKAAADELKRISKCCGWLSIVLPYLAIVFIFGYMNDFQSLIDFIRRAFFLTLLIGLLSLILIFVSFPFIGMIRDLMWRFSMSNIIQNEIRIQNECLSYLKNWECFLMEERSRFKSWKNDIIQARRAFCEKFVLYFSCRIVSPWDLDMPSIRSALQSHYPDNISLGTTDIMPWQHAVWESCRPNGSDSQLAAFSKECFKGTNIDIKIDMYFLK